MTNYVHFKARAKQGFEMSSIIRDMKRHTSKKRFEAIQNNAYESRKEWMLAIFISSGEYNSNNKECQFCGQDNKPNELWSHEVMQKKLDYVHNNPGEAGFVLEAEHWKYSSAIDYSG